MTNHAWLKAALLLSLTRLTDTASQLQAKKPCLLT